ncbi:MAG: hypothetical protein ACKOEW_07760, partial [Methylocystis sp.]
LCIPRISNWSPFLRVDQTNRGTNAACLAKYIRLLANNCAQRGNYCVEYDTRGFLSCGFSKPAANPVARE